MGAEGDLVAERLARRCRCFLVTLENAIAGYGWLSTGPEWIGEIQLLVTPRPGEGYVWNCVTLKGHRRRGVFRSLVAGISEIARGEGLRRLWIGSVAIPAERALGPAGFRPALHAISINVAGLQVIGVTAAGDETLAADAMEVLSTRPGWRVRRSTTRRH